MKRVIAVAVREFSERRVLVFAALVAGLLPLATPWFPGVRGGDTAEARQIMCLILATAFGAGSAFVIGAGIVARDLSENRMGFDFARPIGGASIWAGRFLAALALVVTEVACAVVPTVVAGWFWPAKVGVNAIPELGIGWALLGALGIAILVLPLAHAASIAIRSRTLWLAVDLAAIVIVVVAALGLARVLIDAWAPNVVFGLGVFLGGAAVLALWLASLLQMVMGRTDLRRGHRIQALALWSILFAALGVSSTYAGWVLLAGPEDLVHIEPVLSPSGDWVFVKGHATGRADFRPSFLVNVRDDRIVRLGGSGPWEGSPEFSQDGRRMVWIRTRPGRNESSDVTIVDLDVADPRPRISEVVPPKGWITGALSPDGRRIATVEGSVVSVHDLETGAVVASVRAQSGPDGRFWAYLRFHGDGIVRMYEFTPRLSVYEMDVAARSIQRTGENRDVNAYGLRVFSRDGNRLMVRGSEDKQTMVLDARTAEVLFALPPADARGRAVSFLEDGGVAYGNRSEEPARIHILSPEGSEVRVLDLKRGALWSLNRRPEPGSLVVSFGDPRSSGKLSDLDFTLLDIATGAQREIARGRSPVLPASWSVDTSAAAALAGEVFVTDHGLVRIDPKSGQEKVLAGRL